MTPTGWMRWSAEQLQIAATRAQNAIDEMDGKFGGENRNPIVEAAKARSDAHRHAEMAASAIGKVVIPADDNYTCDGCKRTVEGILSSDAPHCTRKGVFCPECTDAQKRGEGGGSV